MIPHTRKPQLVFVSWAENCSRSDSLAKRLGGESYLIYSPFWGSRYSTVAFKYLSQSLKTLGVLLRKRPRTVLVMSPPFFACIPVWIYSKLTGAQYAIDAHTGAFVDKRWQSTLFIHKFFSKEAVVTLVTNDFLANVVHDWGGNSHVVRDVPVYFAEPRWPELSSQTNMVFISTFTPDEPLEAFLKAASAVPDVGFYVTGRLRDAPPGLLKKAPPNVTFTDFLRDSDYVGLLLAADAAICLTTEDHTMQRGAYEAIYLSRPVITSDFALLRDTFPKGAVHVSPNPDDIVNGINQMKVNLLRYRQEAEQLRSAKLAAWRDVADDLNHLLGLNSHTDGISKTSEDIVSLS